MKQDREKTAKNFMTFFFCFLFAAINLDALEISRGGMRLSLHEETGRFSLYGINENGLFEPLFSDNDPRSSFIELNVNNRVYRLGDSGAFRFRVESAGEKPAIVFESGNLELREEFSFVKTAGSSEINGVQIDIRLRNRGQNEVGAGLRFLLDTCLGEESGETPFFLGREAIRAETLAGGSVEVSWVSRGASLSLAGSVGLGRESNGRSNNSGGKNPDYLHFANWKRLSEASWNFTNSTGRNFNYPPYSFGDAAVCYYYDPVPLSQYGEMLCTILLFSAPGSAGDSPLHTESSAAANTAGASAVTVLPANSAFAAGDSAGTETAVTGSRDADLALLQSLISRIDYYLEGRIEVSAEELAEMEKTIAAIKSRYGIP